MLYATRGIQMQDTLDITVCLIVELVLLLQPLAVVDLTIAQQSKMRILVQLHWLHPIQAVHNFQAMEPNYAVLHFLVIFYPPCIWSSMSNSAE
jgi:hypothetical protein